VSTSSGGGHVLVLGDQLTHQVGPLAGADPAETTILLIESAAWARRRPYHRQKLVLVWSAMRHFAAESRALGFRVQEHRVEAFEDGLKAHWRPTPSWPRRGDPDATTRHQPPALSPGPAALTERKAARARSRPSARSTMGRG
jgi:hypothetical protein